MRNIKGLSRKLYAGCAAAVVSVAYLLLPAVAHAGSVDICGASGPRCNHFVNTYINPALAVLTAAVGVLAVISIVVAGIQYSSSADDPATVTKAKQRIFNTVVGLIAYIFLFAFINYLVPGGIL
jgi:hypothetical protein